MSPVLPSIILAASAVLGSLSPEEAEEFYWDCEYAAAHGTIELDEAAVCSEVYERLKAKKFRGDFNLFLVWWKENKQREFSSRMKHGRLWRPES